MLRYFLGNPLLDARMFLVRFSLCFFFQFLKGSFLDFTPQGGRGHWLYPLTFLGEERMASGGNTTHFLPDQDFSRDRIIWAGNNHGQRGADLMAQLLVELERFWKAFPSHAASWNFMVRELQRQLQRDPRQCCMWILTQVKKKGHFGLWWVTFLFFIFAVGFTE